MSASPFKRPRIPEPEQEPESKTHLLESGQDIDEFINDDNNNVNVGDKIRITSLAQDPSEESPTIYIVKNECRKVAELLNQNQDEDLQQGGKNKRRRENIRRKTNRVKKSTRRVRKTLRRRR